MPHPRFCVEVGGAQEPGRERRFCVEGRELAPWHSDGADWQLNQREGERELAASETKETVYCHTAEYVKLQKPPNLRRYPNVNLVRYNGVQCVLKTFGNLDTENAMHEVNILRRLKHPNINALIDIVFAKDQIHLILEYCKHGDLLVYVQEQKLKRQNISPEIILLWMGQLLSAINHMHTLKIVHGDIKSQNVFVMDERRLCIGDMGSAQEADADGVCVLDRGTFIYSPPEITQGDQPSSTKTDMWGIGCVFFEAMTQISIPDCRNRFTSLVENNAVHSRMLKTQYPEILRRVVTLCLQVDPHKRPSAQALMDMLAGSE